MAPALGTLVGGKYRVLRLIGEGGMGSVYEARHEHLGSRVALKFLHPDLTKNPALVARFLQEARVSAAIKSPHVTQVVDVDQTPEGDAYLVMELLEGESLEHRLAGKRVLAQRDAVDIALQILSALEAAHAKGIVHRDLKPDNVWLEPSPAGPHVKLLDFGIAKLRTTDEYRQFTTRPGSMMGTPAYMAPEQAISADQVDSRADLYSFGVILYEMLSGARPVDAEEPQEILAQLISGNVRPLESRMPSLPRGLSALVDRLVAPNPDARPPSAASVRAELLTYGRGSSTSLGDIGRESTVPMRASEPPPSVTRTVPADLAGAPPYVTSTHTAAGPEQQSHTASMHARELPAPIPASVTGERTRSRGVRLFVVLLLFGVGAFGAWAISHPFWRDYGAPPPLPGPAPISPLPPPALDLTPTMPPVVAPSRSQRKASPSGVRPEYVAPAPSSGSPPLPGPLQMPFPFPVPSGLFSIPSTLPPFIPQIPGITSPAGPAPSSSAR